MTKKTRSPQNLSPSNRFTKNLEVRNLSPDGGGRASTLTPEVHEAVIEGVRNGNYITTVMRAVGLPEENFYHWRRQGIPQPIYDDDGNEIGHDYPDNFYGDFMRDFDEALAYSEIRAVKALQSHFDKDWRAAAEYLSRKFPERWNPKTVVEHQGKDGGPIQTQDRREVLYAQLDMIAEDSEAEVVEIEGQETKTLEQGETDKDEG